MSDMKSGKEFRGRIDRSVDGGLDIYEAGESETNGNIIIHVTADKADMVKYKEISPATELVPPLYRVELPANLVVRVEEWVISDVQICTVSELDDDHPQNDIEDVDDDDL